MRHMAISAISAFLLLVGCAHEKPVAPRPAATPAAPQKAGGALQPETTAAHAPAAAAQPSPAPVDTERAPSAAVPSSRAGTGGSAAATGSGSAKTKVPGR